jgi:uncharacterized Fe-S cluster-containing radical SAM superfamily protein
MFYDAVQRHSAVEKLVTRTERHCQVKKYYRVRPARWYGGIVTADCAGCGLQCRFCWVSDVVMSKPAEVGRFYSGKEIAEELMTLAKKRGLALLRVSGGEPTIGKLHLLQLLDALQEKGYRFILETNGIPIAADEDYASSLSKYRFVHARVSLKGCNEEEFALLTGTKPGGFKMQLKSLEDLVDAGVSCHPAVMTSFSPRKSYEALVQKLKRISPSLGEETESEELILYPHVVRRLRRYDLKYGTAYPPGNVPREQV